MLSFRPNCTSPTASPVFVGAVNVRSTLDIVWSCLTVLFLCTWSIQHLNLPPQFGKGSSWDLTKYQASLIWHKSMWMVLTIIAPEIIFGKAVAYLKIARRNEKQAIKLAQEDGVDWSLAHSYFANMGGFVIHFPPKDDCNAQTNRNGLQSNDHQEHSFVNDSPSLEPQRQRQQGTDILKHFRDANASGSIYIGNTLWALHPENINVVEEAYNRGYRKSYLGEADWESNLGCLQGNVWILNAEQLLYGRAQGIINALPDLPSAELDDKNKSDMAIKLLALIQISWLIIQIIIRGTQDLAVSQLEISTLAIAVSSILTYVVAWKQPHGAQFPMEIKASRFATANEMSELAKRGPYIFNLFQKRGKGHPRNPDSSIPGWHWEAWTLFRASIIGSIVFGLVHVASWNYQFPTTVELLFWRISIVATITLPATIVPVDIASSASRIKRKYPKIAKAIWSMSLHTGSLFYVLARLFMTVETFRTLYYLPPSAYRTTWTTNIPHLG